MSSVNIKRAVENIRANTTVYTPVVEMIVNAVQAIDESRQTGGKVLVRALRNSQAELDGSPSDVTGFDIRAFCKTAESWVIIEDKGVDLTGQAVFA